MHIHVTDVLSRLDRARASLRIAVDAIPPPLHRQKPAPDRWSAAEVVEHLTLVERLFGARIVKAIDAARSAGLLAESRGRTPLPVGPVLLDRPGEGPSKRTGSTL